MKRFFKFWKQIYLGQWLDFPDVSLTYVKIRKKIWKIKKKSQSIWKWIHLEKKFGDPSSSYSYTVLRVIQIKGLIGKQKKKKRFPPLLFFLLVLFFFLHPYPFWVFEMISSATQTKFFGHLSQTEMYIRCRSFPPWYMHGTYPKLRSESGLEGALPAAAADDAGLAPPDLHASTRVGRQLLGVMSGQNGRERKWKSVITLSNLLCCLREAENKAHLMFYLTFS